MSLKMYTSRIKKLVFLKTIFLHNFCFTKFFISCDKSSELSNPSLIRKVSKELSLSSHILFHK